MSFRSFCKLFFGIIMVLAILAGLTLYLNYTMSRVSSSSAKLLSDLYTVGTEYSGTVSRQYVTPGQSVTNGQKLFDITTTAAAAASGTGDTTVPTGSDPAPTPEAAAATGPGERTPALPAATPETVTIKATGDGVVSNIAYGEGSFVPANKEVATITKQDSLYVQAAYRLSPPDYARVQEGGTVHVTLPNNDKVDATIFSIQVQGDGQDAALTLVKARLNGPQRGSTFSAGTPVTTDLRLTGKTLYASLRDALQSVLQPRG